MSDTKSRAVVAPAADSVAEVRSARLSNVRLASMDFTFQILTLDLCLTLAEWMDERLEVKGHRRHVNICIQFTYSAALVPLLYICWLSFV